LIRLGIEINRYGSESLAKLKFLSVPFKHRRLRSTAPKDQTNSRVTQKLVDRTCPRAAQAYVDQKLTKAAQFPVYQTHLRAGKAPVDQTGLGAAKPQ